MAEVKCKIFHIRPFLYVNNVPVNCKSSHDSRYLESIVNILSLTMESVIIAVCGMTTYVFKLVDIIKYISYIYIIYEGNIYLSCIASISCIVLLIILMHFILVHIITPFSIL